MNKKIQKVKPIATLKKEAIRAFNAWIRARDAIRLNGICYTCNKPGDQAGHYIHSHNSVRFNEILVNLQCFNCNHYASGNLGVYGERLIKEHGLKKIQELRRKAQEIKRFSRQELEEIIKKYQP